MEKKEIGKFIKNIRTQKGLLQRELAEKAGIRRATLVDLENGTNFKIETLTAILKALGYKVIIIEE